MIKSIPLIKQALIYYDGKIFDINLKVNNKKKRTIMPKEIYLLIAAILGSGVTIISTIINNIHQRKIAQSNSQERIKIESMKIKADKEKNQITTVRKKLEKAHLILSNISFHNSLTSSTITQIQEESVKEYNKEYLEKANLYDELRMIVDIYYPDLHDDVEKIVGLTNVYWGYHSILLGTDENDSNYSHILKSTVSKVFENSKEMNSLILSVKVKIRRYASSLNQYIEN